MGLEEIERHNTKELYGGICRRNNLNFDLEDTGLSIFFIHENVPITIELPYFIRNGTTAYINLYTCIQELENPETIIEEIHSLIERRDLFRKKGYKGNFQVCTDGVQYIFEPLVESGSDLERVLLDFHI